jgi:hypothetical protein
MVSAASGVDRRAWAAGTPLQLLTTLLDLQPGAPSASCELPDIGRVELRSRGIQR